MPEIVADPPSPSCYHLFPGPGVQESQRLGPDPSSPHRRDARGRFAKGSSGNPRGRPPGIPNPRRRVPDLLARPLSALALSDLLNRKPHLLRPLAAQLLPPPAPIDPAERLGIDLASLQTAEDCRRVLATVLEAVTRGGMAPIDGTRIAKRAGARLRAVARLTRLARRLRGLPQIAFRPDGRESPDQMVDVGLAVQGRGGQAQALGAARHGRVVDRLHIDLELVEKAIGDVPAQYRVADHDRHDMARIVAMRDLSGIEPLAQQPDMLLQSAAFDGAGLQVTDAGQGRRRHSRR